MSRDLWLNFFINIGNRKHVAEVKSKHKWLTGGVHFIDTIPRNPSGKILRRLLREQAKETRIVLRARL
jgi:4-coumarate--CoA ligase